MLARPYESLNQIKARDRETLPTVLTSDEVARVIRAVPLLRYRTPLLLIYACGLRVRECIHLTLDDIDGPGNRLFVRDGKDGKDRYTILSTPVYQLLNLDLPNPINTATRNALLNIGAISGRITFSARQRVLSASFDFFGFKDASDAV